MDLFISHRDIPPAIQTFVSLVTMESVFSLDHFSEESSSREPMVVLQWH